MEKGLPTICRGAAVTFVLLSTFMPAGGQQPVPAQTQTPRTHATGSSQTNVFLDLLKQANEKTRARQWSEAAELWDKLARINPVEGDIWEQAAKTRYENKEYRKAIPAFQKAFELGSGFPCNQAYDVARCYGMLQEKEPAMKWLEKAFELGYRRVDAARTDPALALLHSDARFRDMLGLIDKSKLSRVEGWRHDLQFMAREIRRRSYDPFHKVTREAFDATVKKVSEAIPRLCEPCGPLRLCVAYSREEFSTPRRKGPQGSQRTT